MRVNQDDCTCLEHLARRALINVSLVELFRGIRVLKLLVEGISLHHHIEPPNVNGKGNNSRKNEGRLSYDGNVAWYRKTEADESNPVILNITPSTLNIRICSPSCGTR